MLLCWVGHTCSPPPRSRVLGRQRHSSSGRATETGKTGCWLLVRTAYWTSSAVAATEYHSFLAAPRNYELPAEAGDLAADLCACPGSSRHDVWQAVRASSAAPYCEYGIPAEVAPIVSDKPGCTCCASTLSGLTLVSQRQSIVKPCSRACQSRAHPNVATRDCPLTPVDLDDFNCSDGLRFQDGATTANSEITTFGCMHRCWRRPAQYSCRLPGFAV